MWNLNDDNVWNYLIVVLPTCLIFKGKECLMFVEIEHYSSNLFETICLSFFQHVSYPKDQFACSPNMFCSIVCRCWTCLDLFDCSSSNMFDYQKRRRTDVCWNRTFYMLTCLISKKEETVVCKNRKCLIEMHESSSNMLYNTTIVVNTSLTNNICSLKSV